MTVVPLPVRDAAELVQDQQHGLAAWRREYELRLAGDPDTERDREAQMDARRRLAGLQRTRSAVLACQARRDRGLPATSDAPRAVVVHRNEWMRSRIQQVLSESGVHVIGEGDDGAVAIALAVVDQPDLIVIEDRLPWVAPLEVVSEVRRFAPHTVIAVQMEGGDDEAELMAAGATAVFGRNTRPTELCASCVDAMVARARERSA